MSWRWSRISERSAWKKVLNVDGILIVVGFILSIAGIPILLAIKDSQILVWMRLTSGLLLFCGISFLLLGLSEILSADDCFSVQMGKNKGKVYVYKIENKYRPSFYEILIKAGGREFLVFANQYKKNIYSESKAAFIYSNVCDNGSEIWALINKNSDDIQELGQSVGEYVFISPNQHKTGKIVLNVLQEDGYTEISADRYICKNILVPQESEIESVYNGKIVQVPIPNEYLIVKNDDKYQVWGIYCDEKNNPRSYALSVSSIIFHEGKDTVILLGKHFEYTELYRGQSVGRKSTTLISEVYDKKGYKGVYGTVRRFNPQNKTLEELYTGPIFGILFDEGEIIGENGDVFKP